MQSSSRGRAVRATNSATSLMAGAVTEEQFRNAFEAAQEIKDIKVHSLKDLLFECQKQATILENLNNDWTRRVKALNCLRSLLVYDIDCYGAFAEHTYSLLGTAFELSVKDLRSQVCREACITIAFFCEKLGSAFWRVAEAVIPITMNLTQNSAKVMASSGQVCNTFIAKNVHHPRILGVIVQHISHKAKEVRRMTISLIFNIINYWEPAMVEKHSGELTHAIKLAISDADADARAIARQVFEILQNLYPSKAEALFRELEPAKQRMLVERSSTASSTHSINSERDTLPNPNRGLYNAQNSFLSKRSASDLNHSARRVNLVPQRIVRLPANATPNSATNAAKPPATYSSPFIKKCPMTPTSHTRNGPHAPIPLNIHHKNGTPSHQQQQAATVTLSAATLSAQTNLIKIQKIITAITDKNADVDNVENSLRALTQIIRNGEITNWDEEFNNVFFAIQQAISHPLNDFGPIRVGALKALREICNAQPKRLLPKTELIMMIILNAHENDEATIVRAAEECGAALATKLPTKTCVNLLLTVIDDENSKYHQLSGAIKMLSKVISKLPAEEVEGMVPTVVQRMIRCYENSQSMVRRASIICLVAMSISIGLDKLKPHLNPATLKLVEVYAARMAKRESY